MCVWDASFFQGLHGISKSASDMASFEEANFFFLRYSVGFHGISKSASGMASWHG